MLPEIQRTGDIFFVEDWVSTTLAGHSSVAAANVVRGFLDGPASKYPTRLRWRILSAADGLFRASGSGI
jgi:aminopeptidase N